jgi:dephospho-CoA kinase
MRKKHERDSFERISFTAAKKVVVTGNIATGKSLLQKIFDKKKIPTIDLDNIVEDMYINNPALINDIKELFKPLGINAVKVVDGKEIVAKENIRKRVFADNELRTKLQNLVHPHVCDDVKRFFRKNKEKDIAVVIYPLLFEKNEQNKFDKIILVTVSKEIQFKRLMNRLSKKLLAEGMEPDSIIKECEPMSLDMINSQMAQDLKVQQSHYRVDNNKEIQDLSADSPELKELEAKVDHIIANILESK